MQDSNEGTRTNDDDNDDDGDGADDNGGAGGGGHDPLADSAEFAAKGRKTH